MCLVSVFIVYNRALRILFIAPKCVLLSLLGEREEGVEGVGEVEEVLVAAVVVVSPAVTTHECSVV